MAIERHAHATWEGDLRSGTGRFDVGSGAISGQEVTFASRFTPESGGKTSPEELIAAAHATCFTMALGSILAGEQTPPERLAVSAVITLEEVEGTYTITTSELEVIGRVAGIDQAGLERAAQEAERVCPVSRALAGSVEIRSHSRLEDSVQASS